MQPQLAPLENVSGADASGAPAADALLVRRCLSILGTLAAGMLIGIALSPYLLAHHPLVLIALSPIGRHLILAAPRLDPVAFVSVAVARRLLASTTFFYLGRALGPLALLWLEARYTRVARLLRLVERLFHRASHVVVLLSPGAAVSTIAGSTGMAPARFVTLAALGLAARVILALGLAEWLRPPLEVVLAWIDENWPFATLAVAMAVAAHLLFRRRAARRTATLG